MSMYLRGGVHGSCGSNVSTTTQNGRWRTAVSSTRAPSRNTRAANDLVSSCE